MISLLITLLVVCVVIGLVFWILTLLPIPQPWMNVIRAIIGVIFIIWLLTYLLPLGHSGLLIR